MPKSSRDLTTIIRPLIVRAAVPCPELAAATVAVKKSVCRTHIAELKKEISSAKSLSLGGALDDLEKVLEALAAFFSHPQQLDKLAQLGPAHAAAREGQGFTVAEVFGEYVIFRRILLQQIELFLGRDLNKPENEAFRSGVDAVVAGMLVSFARQQKAEQQLETNAERDRLAALSHDVRNDINGALLTLRIIGLSHSDFLAGEVEESHRRKISALMSELDSCRQAMESTITAAERILQAELVSHLELSRSQVNLRQLMEGIARSVDRVERAKRIAEGENEADTLQSRIDIVFDAQELIETDPDLLSTVLKNFLFNAVKYTAGRIVFKADKEADGFKISVSDSGPGLNSEQCDRLFNKFDRGGRVDGSGTGLGLYVAKKAATLLGATVGVDSEAGKGSTFWIRSSKS